MIAIQLVNFVRLAVVSIFNLFQTIALLHTLCILWGECYKNDSTQFTNAISYRLSKFFQPEPSDRALSCIVMFNLGYHLGVSWRCCDMILCSRSSSSFYELFWYSLQGPYIEVSSVLTSFYEHYNDGMCLDFVIRSSCACVLTQDFQKFFESPELSEFFFGIFCTVECST